MFQSKRMMFFYCVSPVHMGAGTALGAIDSPIQRERHTEHPVFAGSGIKGALRHHLQAAWGNERKRDIVDLFGPDTSNASEQAGALSVSDAQLVAFPVRSMRQSFVYATCPTALARLQRLAMVAGDSAAAAWKLPEVQGHGCVIPSGGEKELLQDGKVVLESYALTSSNDRASVDEIAVWISKHSVSEKLDYFRNKVATHLVVLSDDVFSYFVRNATTVEPHVRIDDKTGTASDGGLFYVENLPADSILVSLAMTTRSRGKSDARTSEELLGLLAGTPDQSSLDDSLVQVGGDASTGRGQVWLQLGGAA